MDLHKRGYIRQCVLLSELPRSDYSAKVEALEDAIVISIHTGSCDLIYRENCMSIQSDTEAVVGKTVFYRNSAFRL